MFIRRDSTDTRSLCVAAALLFVQAPMHCAAAREIVPPPPPLAPAHYERLLQSDPALLERLTHPARVRVPDAGDSAQSRWQLVTSTPPINAGAMLQLTDGTIMIQDQGSQNNGSGNWWRYSPDAYGSYLDGSWTRLASLPSGYAPLYFASEVLPDGRVVIEGGEYNEGTLDWTNQGAIYDPVADGWTSIDPPSGNDWSRIGDGPSALLADGTFMLGASGYSGTTDEALLHAKTLSWTITGSGKADGNGEEGWSLLPDGTILTADTHNTSDPLDSEIYSPTSGAWTTGGSTIVELPDSDGEIGPQVLRPNGTVFAAGASGHNAVYSMAKGKWRAAPDFPVLNGLQYDVADGPAAVLPDGNVLVMASPGEYQTPSHFFLFNGKTLSRTKDTKNASGLSSFYGFMLVLPTGQVMFNDRVGNIWLYTSAGSPEPSWLPVITRAPARLISGRTYKLLGAQLAGLSEGAAYGDDYQSNTNYPLVRIANAKSGHLFYARTFANTTNSVAAGAVSSVRFEVPKVIEGGAASLVVIANGIASSPKSVHVLK